MSITHGYNAGTLQGYWFPSGSAFTLPSAGTASATARPNHEPAITTPTTAASIDTGWLPLGALESSKNSAKPGINLKPFASLTGTGVKTIAQVIQGNIERTFTAMLLARSPFAISLVYRTPIIVDSGSNTECPAVTPDSQAVQNGWLYYELYDASTANLMLERAYFWCAATLNGDQETDSNKQLIYGCDFTPLSSSLNSLIVRNV